eukprot:2322332-Pyramimonas_sp.AAC.1
MQARVEACRKLSRTPCRAAGVSEEPVDRRGGAPGGHHHRPASNLKPTQSHHCVLSGRVGQLAPPRAGILPAHR